MKFYPSLNRENSITIKKYRKAQFDKVLFGITKRAHKDERQVRSSHKGYLSYGLVECGLTLRGFWGKYIFITTFILITVCSRFFKTQALCKPNPTVST